jgi:hypothetical protein
MTGMENKNGFHRIKEQKNSSSDINLNDIHYSSVQAVVEAETGLDALERFIIERPELVFKEQKLFQFKKDEDTEEADKDGFNTGGNTRTFHEPDWDFKDIKISRQILKGRFRVFNNPQNEDDDGDGQSQMLRFKISCTDKPDKLFLVYKMGSHWIVCT